MKIYTCIQPNMSMTLVVGGKLVNAKFNLGVLRCEDPEMQSAIEARPMFGRLIYGEPHGQVLPPEDHQVEAPAKPAKKGKGGKRKAAEEAAIDAFMEKKVDA